MDRISKVVRSKNMAAVRSTKNKSTEIKFLALLRSNKIRGWRRGSKIYGKPDFVLAKNKVAIFVDGCFWHGCKKHKTIPKQNSAFWTNKIRKNKERDKHVNNFLRKEGWKVLRVWEHQLKKPNEAQKVSIKLQNLLY
jgi:DNA mismatch endonuclease (patch repair protein)